MNLARIARLLALWLVAAPALADDHEPAKPDAPLPTGFPEPTDPGTIEVKPYPTYRSAWAKGEDMNLRSGDMLFFWLFRHICERNVEMTVPVINTYLDPEVAIASPAQQGRSESLAS